jgi:hypothetical protein
MIKLKFDSNSDTVDVYRDGDVITSLNPEDFGSLIREIKRIMEEASPAIARKQERKRERLSLIRQFKLLMTVRLINFIRWVKSYWKIINQ